MYIIYEKFIEKPNYSGTSVVQVGRAVVSPETLPKTPWFPSPDRSLTLVPSPSSNLQYPTNPSSLIKFKGVPPL